MALTILATPLSAARAAELSIEGLNKDIAAGDARFDCSRGGYRCRLRATRFGQFPLTRAEAQFESGKLDWLFLNVKASKRDVLAWLTSTYGPPTGQFGTRKEEFWKFDEGAGISLAGTESYASLHVHFRDIPPLHEACTSAEQEAWFDTVPPVKIAAVESDDDDRC